MRPKTQSQILQEKNLHVHRDCGKIKLFIH